MCSVELCLDLGLACILRQDCHSIACNGNLCNVLVGTGPCNDVFCNVAVGIKYPCRELLALFLCLRNLYDGIGQLYSCSLGLRWNRLLDCVDVYKRIGFDLFVVLVQERLLCSVFIKIEYRNRRPEESAVFGCHCDPHLASVAVAGRHGDVSILESVMGPCNRLRGLLVQFVRRSSKRCHLSDIDRSGTRIDCN